jgi:hypothetical protein
MSMRSKDFAASGVPVLNVGCVRWGYFDESKLDYMPPAIAADFDDTESQKLMSFLRDQAPSDVVPLRRISNTAI